MGEHRQQEHCHEQGGRPPSMAYAVDNQLERDSNKPPLPALHHGQPLARPSVSWRTRGHVARVLQRFGYAVTERALTDWSSEGYLPHPVGRGRGRGGGRVYAYEQQNIVRHAAIVYQLMRWRSRGDYHYFPLWLLG